MSSSSPDNQRLSEINPPRNDGSAEPNNIIGGINATLLDMKSRLDAHASLSVLEKALTNMEARINSQVANSEALKNSDKALETSLEALKNRLDATDERIGSIVITKLLLFVGLPAMGLSLLLTILGAIGIPTLLQSVADSKLKVTETKLTEAATRYGELNNKLATLYEKRNRAPVVCIATDFAQNDYYSQGMRAAILQTAPQLGEIPFIELPKFYEAEGKRKDALTVGALRLAYLSRLFPPDTVFAVEMNPGGQRENIIVFKNQQDQYFVGFENKLAELFAKETGIKGGAFLAYKQFDRSRAPIVYGINPKPGISIVAGLAAEIARDGPERVNTLSPYTMRTQVVSPSNLTTCPSTCQAVVVDKTRFGDCLLAMRPTDLGIRIGDTIKVTINEQWQIDLRHHAEFCDVDKGSALSLDFAGMLTLAINFGHFDSEYVKFPHKLVVQSSVLSKSSKIEIGDVITVERLVQ